MSLSEVAGRPTLTPEEVARRREELRWVASDVAASFSPRDIEARRELDEIIAEDWIPETIGDPEQARHFAALIRASTNTDEIERMDREAGAAPRDAASMFALVQEQLQLELERGAGD
jgi:hypothetical protein